MNPAQYRKLILILSFAGVALGWRGLNLGFGLKLYASEFFIWTGFVASMLMPVRAPRISSPPQSNALPMILAYCALLGVIVGFANGNRPQEIIIQAKGMLCFVPILAMFRKWIHTEEDIFPCAVTLVASGVIIALLGTFEFVFPAMAKSLRWLFVDPGYTRTNFGTSGTISLSGFSSWGTPVVGVMLVPAFGFWIAIRKSVPQRFKALSYVAAGFLVVGIVLSGYRSAWGGMIVITGLLLLFDRKIVTGLIFAGLILFYALPQEFFARLTTMWLLGQSGDTSLIRRENTLKLTLSTIQEHPLLGTGWGSFSTYNDFAYVALALGIPALVVFCLWYISNLARTWRVARLYSEVRPPKSLINPIGFLSALGGYVFCMMSGAMSNVQPLMINFWLMFCLLLRYTEISSIPNHDRLSARSRPQ